MNRRPFLQTLATAAALCPLALRAGETAARDPEPPPRWGFLGDDESLKQTINDCGQVLLVCIDRTSLEDVDPPFAEVVLRATVIQAVKGTHKTGDRIEIRFRTDSLPEDAAERARFIGAAAAKNLGALKMAFLPGDRAVSYECDWLDVPGFDPGMLDFATKHQAGPRNEEK